MKFWIVKHAHRHGSDHLLVQCERQPLGEDCVPLFDDFEEDREDEWLEIIGPMSVHLMVYDKDNRLLPRGHALKKEGT